MRGRAPINTQHASLIVSPRTRPSRVIESIKHLKLAIPNNGHQIVCGCHVPRHDSPARSGFCPCPSAGARAIQLLPPRITFRFRFAGAFSADRSSTVDSTHSHPDPVPLQCRRRGHFPRPQYPRCPSGLSWAWGERSHHCRRLKLHHPGLVLLHMAGGRHAYAHS
jgi:hypothetical protein